MRFLRQADEEAFLDLLQGIVRLKWCLFWQPNRVFLHDQCLESAYIH